MSRKKQLAAYIIAKIIQNRRNRRRERKCWVREWVARRQELGFFSNLFVELSVQDPLQLKNFLRISASELEILLSYVGPTITKLKTNMRDPICAKERLVLTLRFLASGDSFTSLQYVFRIPTCTISKIVPAVCDALFQCLKRDFLKTPSTEEEWLKISQEFEAKWHFPHCVGAVDGKHVVMVGPKDCGSLYFNYKGSHSIVSMAVADAGYKFLHCNFGCNGRVADGGVFNNSSLALALEDNTLQLPRPKPLLGREKDTPYVLVADDAFALKPYMMKPYPHKNQPGMRRIFNYRLSRARRVVENAFGIMANRFRVLRGPINLPPKKVTQVVGALCVLHNFCLEHSGRYYADVGDSGDINKDCDGVWREEGLPNGTLLPAQLPAGHNYSDSAKSVREEFKSYFSTDEGEVLWQYKYI